MKKYAILMVLAAMLCGTEAGATPSISYETFDTGPGHLFSPHALTGNLDPTKNVSSEFRTFGFNPALVLNDTTAPGDPGLLVSHVNILITVPTSDFGANVNFYIDNINVTADGAARQTIGFDDGVFGSILDPQGLEVPVLLGTAFDTFEVRGFGGSALSSWEVSLIGAPANSLFFGSLPAGGTANITIWRPDRYTQKDIDDFVKNEGFSPTFHVGDKKTGGIDAGASFFFHSADLKFVSDGISDGTSTGTSTGTGVPEPASLLLLGAGLAGIGIWRRKVAR